MAKKTLVTGDDECPIGADFWIQEVGSETVKIWPHGKEFDAVTISRDDSARAWFTLTQIARGEAIPRPGSDIRVYHLEDVT